MISVCLNIAQTEVGFVQKDFEIAIDFTGSEVEREFFDDDGAPARITFKVGELLAMAVSDLEELFRSVCTGVVNLLD